MAPSPKNLTATALVLLLIAAAGAYAEMTFETTCRHLSGRYAGVCLGDDKCEYVCLHESSDNIGGFCDGFPSKCWCTTRCLAKTNVPPASAHIQP
ncbi:hypothetical protein BS78_08G126500 [Paspalum vaginatum]|nr:hypothetical protein BS78_08G126500 [Paspalum vaginatum]